MGTQTFPTSPAELTPEWLTRALTENGAIDGAQVKSSTVKIIGEGSGFMGQLARVDLQYDRPAEGAPTSLIAKFAAAAAENRGLAMFFHFYEREVRFYERIAEQVALRTPRCYFGAFEPSNGDYVLLLEDLSPASVGDQVAGCPAEHVKLAIIELAKFQATWWNSPELKKLDWMPGINAEWNIQAAELSYEPAWGPFAEFAKSYLTPVLRETGERFGKSVRGLMNRFSEELPTTIVHGDYRLDNMFFASPKGGPAFAVIDWQIASRAGGVFDVAYFVTGTLPEEERRARERDILKLYHDTLVEHGVKGYSFEQCWEDYRLSILFLLVYSVLGIGTLDLANPRGVELFTKISRRTLAAISDLKAYELLV